MWKLILIIYLFAHALLFIINTFFLMFAFIKYILFFKSHKF